MIFLILIKDDFLSEEKDERNFAMISCATCKKLLKGVNGESTQRICFLVPSGIPAA
jgi:hypothetical protein